MWSKAPYDYSAEFGLVFFRFGYMRHFYGLGISGRVHDSQNQHDSSLETTGYFEESKKIPNNFESPMLINLELLEIEHFENVGEDGRRKLMKIRLKHLENLEYGLNIFQKT